MNEREKNLIRILYEKKNTFIIIKDLENQEECSDKTIRNSLDKVELYLERFSFDLKLERIRGKGICLNIKENSNITLKDILGNNYYDESILSTNERRFELAYMLLMKTKPITLAALSNRYYVNKKVIINDLNQIGKRLEKYNLKVVSKQKIGNFIEGSEKNKRKALSQEIKNLNQFKKDRSTLKSIFMSYEIELVSNAIFNLQQYTGINFTDEYNEALTIHILFMIKRIKMNQPIKVYKDQQELVETKLQYLWAGELANNLEKSFFIKIPRYERVYLAVQLLGARYCSGNCIEINDFTFEIESNFMDVLLNRLMDSMEEISEVCFRLDETLINGLKLHLYGSFNRIKYGLILENPLFQEIKQMNPYLYYRIFDVVDKFNSEYNMHIPKEEVAYITVHFQASIERNNNNSIKKYSAVVVCHLGIGVSNYLKIKLEKMFPYIEFKENVSVKEIQKYTKKNPKDLIFSTVDIDKLYIKYIKINSIIDKQEEIKIKETVNRNIINYNLQKGIKVCKYINKKFIFLRKKFNSRIEVINFITDRLYELGYSELQFCKSVLRREFSDSTEIGNLLAIPHGDTEYIKHSTISILTLEKPILWNNERVQIVFLLAVKKEDYLKDNTMRNFFKHINNLSNDKKVLEDLVKEDNIYKFLNHIV